MSVVKFMSVKFSVVNLPGDVLPAAFHFKHLITPISAVLSSLFVGMF